MRRNRLDRKKNCVTPKAVPAEIAEPIGVSVPGIAARGGSTAKLSRPEMAPQRLEKIESAPGNGMGSEASTYKIWYTGAR